MTHYLEKTDDGQAGRIDLRADPGGAQSRPGATEEFGLGIKTAQFGHQERSVQIARSFAGGDQDFGDSHQIKV